MPTSIRGKLERKNKILFDKAEARLGFGGEPKRTPLSNLTYHEGLQARVNKAQNDANMPSVTNPLSPEPSARTGEMVWVLDDRGDPKQVPAGTAKDTSQRRAAYSSYEAQKSAPPVPTYTPYAGPGGYMIYNNRPYFTFGDW